MSKQEDLIDEAIQFAKSQGVNISRGGAIFNWCQHDSINYTFKSTWSIKPLSCNALGAVLFKLGKESMVKETINPEWLTIVCNYLDVDPFWIARFTHGFDYGTQITLIRVDKDKKEAPEKDKISQLGLQLAAKYAKYNICSYQQIKSVPE